MTHAHNTLEDNNYKLGQNINEMKKEMENILCSEKEKAKALADSSLLIEKMTADYENQVYIHQQARVAILQFLS